MPSRPATVATAVLVAILGASGAVTADDPEWVKPSTLEGSSLTWCGDIEPIVADPSRYRDRPVYFGNEMPTGKVKRWAKERPGFVDLWIDRENFGWVTLAFTGDDERRQRELERAFPGVGVVVVGVEHDKQALRAVGRRFERAMDDVPRWSGSYGIDTVKNVFGASVDPLTEDVVTRLEPALSGEPFCIDGIDPAMVIQPGPQPTDGDGWRLVGHLPRGHVVEYGTALATEAETFASQWRAFDMPGDVPPVAFEDELVAWFSVTHGSSCDDHRLDAIDFDLAHRVVHPVIVLPGAQTVCTMDLRGAHQWAVALRRDRLPSGPFTLSLRHHPDWGPPTTGIAVATDLSQAGAVATAGDLGKPEVANVRRSGGHIQPGRKRTYRLDATCGIAYLGELNSTHWASGRTAVPRAWQPSLRDDGSIDVAVRFQKDPPKVTATKAGVRVTYRPVRSAPTTCEAEG